jgi:hypothetical protein
MLPAVFHYSGIKQKVMSDTEKRYTYQLAEGVTATFNTPAPSNETLTILAKVIELARKYHPKAEEVEKPWHPSCTRYPSDGHCNCG